MSAFPYRPMRTGGVPTTGAWAPTIAIVTVILVTAALDIRLAAVLTFAICLVQIFYRHPLLLLSLWPVVNLTDVLFPYASIRVGPFLLLAMDPVYFFTLIHLGLCALLQPSKISGVVRENKFLCVFLAMVALYIVLYTPIYGQSAIGEGRKDYAFFLVPLLALLVIKTREDLRRFLQITILVAALVAILALGSAVTQGTTIKVVGAEGALIITFAAFAMLIHRFYRVVVFHPTMDRLLLFLFAALAIGLGHRSVWLAIGFGLLLVPSLHLARPAFVVKCVVVALGLLMAGGAALVYFPTVAARLGKGFAGIINPYADNTASWRIEGWSYQLDQLENSGGLLFGDGLGAYYSWKYGWNEETIKVAPHNAYVQLILKFGLFGLIIYALLGINFFRRTLAARRNLAPGPMRAYIETGIVNVGAAHVYILGYGFHLIPLIFFAIAISAAKLSQRPLRQPYRAFRTPTRLISLQGHRAPIGAHGLHRLDPKSSRYPRKALTD